MRKKAVFGIVRTRAESRALISALESSGFSESDVSVLFPGHGQTRDFAIALGTKSAEGALVGGATGGLAAAALGLAAGIGMITLPGLGLLVAAGPLLATLSAAGVGGLLGAIVGGVVGLGVPELRAKAYEGKLRGGNIVVVLHTEDSRQLAVAKQVFLASHAEDVSVTTEHAVPGGAKRAASGSVETAA